MSSDLRSLGGAIDARRLGWTPTGELTREPRGPAMARVGGDRRDPLSSAFTPMLCFVGTDGS